VSNSVGPLSSSFNNMDVNASLRVSQQLYSEVNQYKAIINKQEFALARIRDIALNRRNAFDLTSTQNTENIRDIRDINALTEIYNLTLINLNSEVKPL
jgi:hypothetical protein